MHKSNVHVVISRLSELSSWTRGTQCQVRFADLKTKQPPLIGTFPFPNTDPNGVVARKIFLLMLHKILDEIKALCQKLSLQRCKGSQVK